MNGEGSHCIIANIIRHFACRQNAVTAHIISPAVGANFAMYMAKMSAGGSAAPAAPNVERWVDTAWAKRASGSAYLPAARSDYAS